MYCDQKNSLSSILYQEHVIGIWIGCQASFVSSLIQTKWLPGHRSQFSKLAALPTPTMIASQTKIEDQEITFWQGFMTHTFESYHRIWLDDSFPVLSIVALKRILRLRESMIYWQTAEDISKQSLMQLLVFRTKVYEKSTIDSSILWVKQDKLCIEHYPSWGLRRQYDTWIAYQYHTTCEVDKWCWSYFLSNDL